jgi:hypothetical protein
MSNHFQGRGEESVIPFPFCDFCFHLFPGLAYSFRWDAPEHGRSLLFVSAVSNPSHCVGKFPDPAPVTFEAICSHNRHRRFVVVKVVVAGPLTRRRAYGSLGGDARDPQQPSPYLSRRDAVSQSRALRCGAASARRADGLSTLAVTVLIPDVRSVLQCIVVSCLGSLAVFPSRKFEEHLMACCQ